MARLVKHVSLRDDTGNVVSFGPGEDVPEWASKRITNPAVWEGGEAPESVAGGDTGGSDGSAAGGTLEPPPRGGAGGGRDAWAEYASHFTDKVTITEDDKRDEIIDKLEKAGVRVE
jgi:hypothetical protein